MKKLITILLALCLMAASCTMGLAEEDAFFPALNGTYIELFPEFAREEYKDYWMECIKAHVSDDELAAGYYAYMTAGFMGTLRGQEAIEAYGEDPTGMIFNCFFLDGIAKLTIEAPSITGYDESGAEVFSYTYHYEGEVPCTMFGQELGVSLKVYTADDESAGAFSHFAFTDDTLEETQHIEFRYGETLEDIGAYTEGAYAYWLAAGTQDGYDEELLKACIKLFVDENLAEEAGDTAKDAVEIATAEELAAINDALDGHYVLTADIDLTGVDWTPIGTYAPSGESAEEQEIPDPSLAFTGTFDGQGHTISGLTIDQPEGWALGLFGCASGAEIKNFTVENASVDGSVMTADVVGYSYLSTVSDITLIGGKVTAHAGEMSGEGMYGGIVGAGMGSSIENCTAEADIVLPDDTANAGIVGGGLELTSVVGCTATGTITAGNNCYGLGGVSGCGFGAERFEGDTAQDVTIEAGAGCRWIGGITGYAGGFEMAEAGVPVTQVADCAARNVAIRTADTAEGAAALVGAGFYSSEAAEALGAPFDQPTIFEIVDPIVENVTLNGEAIE